jgi:hypothetical protein
MKATWNEGNVKENQKEGRKAALLQGFDGGFK